MTISIIIIASDGIFGILIAAINRIYLESNGTD